jgi:hypothetical protein
MANGGEKEEKGTDLGVEAGESNLWLCWTGAYPPLPPPAPIPPPPYPPPPPEPFAYDDVPRLAPWLSLAVSRRCISSCFARRLSSSLASASLFYTTTQAQNNTHTKAQKDRIPRPWISASLTGRSEARELFVVGRTRAMIS